MADVKAKVKTPKKKASKREKKDWIAAYILIAPVTLGLLVFYIWPFIQNVWFSFNDVNKFNMSTFVGLANYKEMIGDKEVWRTFGNTLKYVIVTVPVGLALSTFLAALLNAKIKGKSIYRTLYFLPSVTMSAAVAMVWKWIYNEQMGILNSAIKAMGGTGHNWLTDSKTALFMIMIVGLWMTVGYNMIILLAGMQGINSVYYEAAAIDGASEITQFFKITVPMLTPTVFFVMITSIISGFQVFDTVYMMIGKASPAFEATQTVVALFYRTAFDYGYKGYAAAISILIFAAIMIVTVIQMIVHLILLVGVIVVVFPFAWMILTSFKTSGEAMKIPPTIFPEKFVTTAYHTIVTSAIPFATVYMNTIITTVVTTLVQIVFCSMAGYAFGRIEFPFKNAIFILVLSVLMVPGQIFLLPQYQIVQKLGLLDTIPALFLPNLFSAFGTFLLRQFFMSLPKELEEAAIVDGCGRFRIFAQIMLPLIKPGIVAMSIFTIKFAWNDFMWPLIVNTSMNKMTLGPALSTLQGQYTTEYPMQMAGAVLAVLPLVVMFFIFQKQFIEGVAQSGIKG